MQFKFAFIATALFVSAFPAMSESATVQFFAGADCTGTLIGTINNAQQDSCVFVKNGGSGRSVGFSGTNTIQFYESGGGHDNCTHGSQLTLSGSGCSNAPNG